MALRNIITEEDERLRKVARPVAEVNDHIREVLQDMYETMMAANGVGLAAPQIGMPRRMFVILTSDDPDNPGDPTFMINPEILESSGSQIGQEGCLSVPGLVGDVDRPDHIKVKALDLDGKEQIYEFDGFAARVTCHEYDHLDGILYTDKSDNVHDPFADEEEEE